MNDKQVKFADEARAGLKSGLDTVANAVKATLGPRGRMAAIQRTNGAPLVTKDGVTVARSIQLSDKHQNMGAQLIKSVASATNSIAGDGTTTATVLAQAIYNEGAKLVSSGNNPVLIKRGIDMAVSSVIGKLKDISLPISDAQTIKHVAAISANNDMELGSIIADAVEKVGTDGVISVEESTGATTSVAYAEGIEFGRGYLSTTFITSPDKMIVEFDNPYIVFYDEKLSFSQDFLSTLQTLAESKRPFLIIARDVEGEALQTLILNKARGMIVPCAIKAPGFGDTRRDMLEDMAMLCGGKVFTNEDGQALRQTSIEDFGQARKVIVTKNSTMIIDGAGDRVKIRDRIDALRQSLQDRSLFEHQLDSIKTRLSKLSGGVAVFRVGGSTEAEMRERKDRVEDAINAVRAAISEGVVPGGGAALLHCLPAVKALHSNPNLLTEERIGISIVEKAILVPFKQILSNAGFEYHEYMQKIMSSGGFCGFDALRDCFVQDMLSVGIVDPTKVVRSALEHAASASGTLLTTEVVIFDEDVMEQYP